MRLVHTSDWHLGRGLHGARLLDDQLAVLDWLVELVRAERADAVVVAGDLYDRALPTPDTVTACSEILERLVDTGATVVVTSGNHDSATRLGFGSGLLERAGLHIRSSAARVAEPVVVADTAIYALPYLEPATTAAALGATERTHAAVLRAALDRVRADLAHRRGPAVVTAHAFVAGAVASASERDISVGGVSVVPAAVFDGFAYAALGHLHRPQRVCDGIAYSGSPSALSFGEVDQVKSVALVEVDGPRTARATTIPTPVPRPLAVLRGRLEDLLRDPRWVDAERSWCQVVLTDSLPPPGAFDRLRRRFAHLVHLTLDPPPAAAPAAAPYALRTRAGRPELDVCCDFLAHVRGGIPADADERAAIEAALDASRVARHEHEDLGGRDELGVAGRGVA